MNQMHKIYWLSQHLSEVPDDNTWLSRDEQTKLRSFKFEKRMSDWRLGRWTAKLLLHHFAPKSFTNLADIEILPAADGAPEVRLNRKKPNIVLSLSHSRNYGFSTLCFAGSKMGCDIEVVAPKSESFVSDYFTLVEQQFYRKAHLDIRPLTASLIWSAKESTLKALREGLRLDTKTVEVRLYRMDETKAWQPLLTVFLPDATPFRGWWRTRYGMVETMVTDSFPSHLLPVLNHDRRTRPTNSLQQQGIRN